jgi:hypothetical protein
MSTTLPESHAEKVIAEKIKEWEDKKKGPRPPKEIGAHPFIAIARDYGCGEDKLIPLFEKTFGWKVYGRNLLDHIANRDALSRQFIETLDEHHENQLEQWVNYLISSGSLLPSDYMIKLSKLIKVVVTHENAIFLGRGTNYILQDKPHGVRVKLTAPFQDRVRHIAQLKNVSEKEAEEMVKRVDEERGEFIYQHFQKEYEDPSDFDIVLNTQSIPEESICKMISMVLEIKKHAAP